MSLLDLLNPVKDLADLVNSIVGKFVTDPAQRVALQQQLLAAQTALQTQALALQAQVVDAQARIVTAEAQGASWLERDWRPLLMLFFAVIVGFAVFNGGHDIAGRAINPEFVNDALTIVKIGVGGYVAQPVIAALGALKSNGK